MCRKRFRSSRRRRACLSAERAARLIKVHAVLVRSIWVLFANAEGVLGVSPDFRYLVDIESYEWRIPGSEIA
jgi:hypothetical protein